MRVVEAADGQPLKRGVAYIAPGDLHLTRRGARPAELRTPCSTPGRACTTSGRRSTCCSTRRRALRGVPIVALLLTGMGSDGADGMVALREAGADRPSPKTSNRASCSACRPRPSQRGGAAHVAPLSADAAPGRGRLRTAAAAGRAVQTSDRAVQSSDKCAADTRPAPARVAMNCLDCQRVSRGRLGAPAAGSNLARACGRLRRLSSRRGRVSREGANDVEMAAAGDDRGLRCCW